MQSVEPGRVFARREGLRVCWFLLGFAEVCLIPPRGRSGDEPTFLPVLSGEIK